MSYLVPRKNLAFRKLGDAVFIIELNGSRNLHELNETASVIWSLCDGKHSPEQIAARLAEAFELDSAEAERDVRAFLAELTEKNLLVSRDAEQA